MCSHAELAFMTDPPSLSAVATNLSLGIPDEREFFSLSLSLLKTYSSLCSSLKMQSLEDKLRRVNGTLAVGRMTFLTVLRRTQVLGGSCCDPQETEQTRGYQEEEHLVVPHSQANPLLDRSQATSSLL